MKIFLSLLISFTAISFALNAQQNHFVFIQSDNRQPFNITLNNKVFSSTASGYVIIPKILAGIYSISIGFGGNVIPDQNFNIEVLQKDLGYTLKYEDRKGWALLNLQSFEATYADNIQQQSPVVAVNKNKPSLNIPDRSFQPEINSPVPNVTRQKIDTISKAQIRPDTISNTDTSNIEKFGKVNNESQSLQKVKESAIEMEPAKEKIVKEPQSILKNKTSANNSISKNFSSKPTITKISELKGGEAIYITFVDKSFNQTDTINVLIQDNVSQVLKEEKPLNKSAPKFLDIKSSPSYEVSKSDAPYNSDTKGNDTIKPSYKIIVANCNSNATNDDFLKLRRKMAAAIDNDAMIAEAKKIFKGMCFSTEQVKNLAYLFLTDQSRYQFFDAAFPAVADPAIFNSLSLMLSDAYYVNRFKAMLIN